MRSREVSSKRPTRRAFALVVCLALLSLAVATLSRLAQSGLSQVLEARTAEKRLQRDWAEISCRAVVLEQADLVFSASDALRETAGLGWPHPGRIDLRFELSATSYSASLIDEQAKLNLNAVHDDSPTRLSDVLVDLQRSSGSLPLRLTRPESSRALARGEPAYSHLGQVIDLARLRRLPRPCQTMLRFADQITIGQDVRLNVARTSDETLKRVAMLVLTPTDAESLVQARRGRTGSVRDWLAAADIPSRRLVGLRRYLSDRSTAYSLWLADESSGRLAVMQTGLRRGRSTPQVLQWP